MNAKEKARELVDKFANFECDDNYEVFESSISSIEAIQCALICVDEIIDAFNRLEDYVSIVYWELVKKEIQLL